MTYPEALAWLYGLQRFGIKLGLENIHRLIGEIEVNPDDARTIHVAGTNGKGSVCAMIDSICRAEKYRTGLFISPHLVTFRERIRVDGEMISENEVASGLARIRKLVASWDPHPTFFEVTTALALKHFAGAGIDVMILETGLGGRLDATNAVQSDVAVITPIALDHEKWLGDSLEKIAAEKAGIIKAKTPVVSAPQLVEAEKVIRARALECEAPLHFVDQPYTKSPVALPGEHQKVNAAIAVAAIAACKLDRLKRSSLSRQKIGHGAGGSRATRTEKPGVDEPGGGPIMDDFGIPALQRRRLDRLKRSSLRTRPQIEIDDAAIVRGLATVEWPARFQFWDKRTVIDGAHNPAAAKILVATWREVFANERATLILAILSDKDLRAICEALAPISDTVLLPKIRTERAVDPTELAEIFDSVSGAGASHAHNSESVRRCPTISIIASFGEAFAQARKRSAPILIAGSLHFAGEALAHLQGRPAAFEECNQ